MHIRLSKSPKGITFKAVKKRFKTVAKAINQSMNKIHFKTDIHEAKKENLLTSEGNHSNLAPISFNTQPFDFAFSGFKGIKIEEKKSVFGGQSKKQITSRHSLDLQKIEANIDHLDMMIWFQMLQALTLSEQQNSNHAEEFIPAQRSSSSVFRAAVSAALIISTQSDERALGIYHLILHYAEQALTPMPFEPEAFSMLPLVIEDLRGCIATLHKEHQMDLNTLRELADQIASSCNEELRNAWTAFVTKSQMLAWLGYAPEQILSAAVHGSDDAAIRNIATSLSETLGMTPLREFPIHKHYNPFMIEQANKRSHDMLVKDISKTLLSEAVKEKSPTLLYHQAQKQCEALLNGHVIGWCAGMLIALSHFFERSFETYTQTNSEEIFIEDALLKAEKEAAHISWATLEEYAQRIVEMHRRGIIPDKDEELQYLQQYPDTAPLAQAMNDVEKRS